MGPLDAKLIGWNKNKDGTKYSDEILEQPLTHKNLACTHLLYFLVFLRESIESKAFY